MVIKNVIKLQVKDLSKDVKVAELQVNEAVGP